MPENQAKISKIIVTDYMSFMFFLFSIFGAIFGPFVILIWLLTLPILFWRVSLIKKTINEGSRAKGVITERKFTRGEWRIHYGFKIAGETVVVRNFIVMFRPPFKEGDIVEIAYDPQKPKTAFLPILYATPLSKWVRRIGIALLSIAGLAILLLAIGMALT